MRLAGFPCYRVDLQFLLLAPRLAAGLIGGAEEARTPDIRLAKAALSQLSYGPSGCTVSHGRWAVATVPAPGMDGGPFWTRTRDLSLIRTAL